jgi:hypothetical protein
MHPAATRAAALDLVAAGLNDCQIARRLGIPRTTIRDWRRRPSRAVRATCPRCRRPARPCRFEAADYAELLGLYLGDGHITAMPRTQRLRLFLDTRHARIVAETRALLRRCFPEYRTGVQLSHGGSMAVLWTYSGHLTCLFPQHGPGKKHARPIALEPWQNDIVAAEPWAFLRGCIRSDGCVYINRTGPYEYLSYCFDNLSADIRGLFAATCSRVGVEYRLNGTSVRVYRRASDQLLLDHVGLKS